MLDIFSFLIGLLFEKKKAKGSVVIIDESEQYTFTDENSDGNIVIEEAE